MKYTPSGDQARSYISCPEARIMFLTLHASLSSTSSPPKTGLTGFESGTQHSIFPSSPAELYPCQSSIRQHILPSSSIPRGPELLTPKSCHWATISPHLQLDCASAVYSDTQHSASLPVLLSSTTTASRISTALLGVCDSRLAYPDIIISSSGRQTCPMRLEVCGVYGRVGFVPLNDQWFREHCGSLLGELGECVGVAVLDAVVGSSIRFYGRDWFRWFRGMVGIRVGGGEERRR